MNKPKIATSLAALALSAVLVSGAAFAQSSGKPANDGGYIPEPAGSASRPIYNSVPQNTTVAPPHYGKPIDDGGLIDEPGAAAKAAAERANQHSTIADRPHYGRPINDGGSID